MGLDENIPITLAKVPLPTPEYCTPAISLKQEEPDFLLSYTSKEETPKMIRTMIF